ncbi:hypothetical protein ACIQ7Q_31780 [Streptomyces sp. NPDC096176]|uniref:hypothetical protein n=1 Tax=Streptomyces sp. NPDC096176 TaxID=3366079 RepID=UPI00381BA5DB
MRQPGPPHRGPRLHSAGRPAGHRPRLLLENASGSRTIDFPADDQVAAALAAFTAAVAGTAPAVDGAHDLLAQADVLFAIRRAAAKNGAPPGS